VWWQIVWWHCAVAQLRTLEGTQVELLRIFLFGLPDNKPSHISVAVFCAVDDFLKSCNRF